MHLGFVYDLQGELARDKQTVPDAEAELASPYEIQDLIANLESLGHTVTPIGDFERLLRFIAGGYTVDLVFNYAVGKHGPVREAQVPALLEALRIPYTGADPFSLALCMDKAAVKRLWREAGLPTTDFVILRRVEELATVSLPPWPLFVKPVREGSSKGISAHSRVENDRQLREQVAYVLSTYQQPALVEPYLPGPEFSAGVVGSHHTAHPLGVVEILQSRLGYADYHDKQQWQDERFRPVKPPEFRAGLCSLALQAYQGVYCEGIGRVDIRLDQNRQPMLMEINPNPVLHAHDSSMSAIANQAGLSNVDLLASVIEMAVQRWKNAPGGSVLTDPAGP